MASTTSKLILGFSESLPTLVSRKYASAKDSGALIFSETHLTVVNAFGIPFQLRYCPTLAKKPTPQQKPDSHSEAQDQKPSEPNKKFNPFENPSSDLLVTTIPSASSNSAAPTHNLVLNKFPIIPNHFILATKAYKLQTDLLEEADLAAAYACIQAWGEESEVSTEQPRRKHRLFAFFNCGDESGASQPHRHLQFLPVEDMMAQEEGEASEGSSWVPLIDLIGAEAGPNERISADGTETFAPRQLNQLPFQHYALHLYQGITAEDLHKRYLFLHQLAKTNIKTDANEFMSYNLALTSSTMFLCPRHSEGATFDLGEAGSESGNAVGNVNLNGTILAGTLMVKAEVDFEALKRNPWKLEEALKGAFFESRAVEHL